PPIMIRHAAGHWNSKGSSVMMSVTPVMYARKPAPRRAAVSGGRSVLVRLAETMRRDGERDDLDAFFPQRFDFLGRRGAADVTLGRLVVMNLACFLGEGAADVL